jgi:lysine 6-dehydrogenase
MLVLGAGLQGSSAAYHLLQHEGVTQVTIADLHPHRLPAFLQPYLGKRLRAEPLDASDFAAVASLMAGHDAALCALPYYFNEPMTRAAIDSGCHFSDLGGNTDIVFQQKKLHDRAVARGISVVPDCGLAPGMVNILAAEGIRRLDLARSVRIYVGGLPQHPEPPLNYQIVYSLEGALDYYTTPSWVLRGGQPLQVDALSGLEPQEFPAPVGTLEAFHTGGGISTMPFAWQGRIETMEYKTLRYPGHVAIMHPIRELGLISNTPIPVKGAPVVPRDVFIAAVQPRLFKPEGRDLVALRVVVEGERAGVPARAAFELLDYYDAAQGISAMMRTTGFSLSLTALMQAGGTITARGVHTPDEAVPFRPYLDGLARAGVRIEERA